MSNFLNRFREASKKKAKTLKKKMVKRALQLAQIYTPIDKGILRKTVKEVDINDFNSLIVWGDSRTETKSGHGYEFFVAFGTKYQMAQLYHIEVAKILAREFPTAKFGSSSGQIIFPSKYY